MIIIAYRASPVKGNRPGGERFFLGGLSPGVPPTSRTVPALVPRGPPASPPGSPPGSPGDTATTPQADTLWGDRSP